MTGAVICGIGQTAYSYDAGRSENQLAMEAIRNACTDAGIDAREIDGIVSYPFAISAEEIFSTLRLHRLDFSCSVTMGGASAVASLQHAALAVTAGVARYVLVLRARTGSSGARVQSRPSPQPAQHFRRELEHPYGWNVPAQRYAMICRRYMIEHGLEREHLASVAVAASRNAQLNPAAQRYGRPVTLEKYLGGEVIADPYTRYDCCLETDGACAVIVAAAGDSRAGVRDPRILAVAEGRPQTPDDLTNRPDPLRIGLDAAAERVWERSGLGPEEMDAAMIYDCFTFELLHQLESAGLAPLGRSGELFAAGHFDLGGPLPVNPHGGLLAEGHLSGLNHVLEAVRQLRNECGDRQVEGARHIVVTGWGDLGDGSIAVLSGAGV